METVISIFVQWKNNTTQSYQKLIKGLFDVFYLGKQYKIHI